MNRKVYCHTTYDDSINTPSPYNILDSILEGNWYIVKNETSNYYVIQHSNPNNLSLFYKGKKMHLLFSDHFYTQEEYRDRKLNCLLNE